MTHRSAVPLACLLIFLAASPAHASWPNNVFVNVPLCTAANNQYTPTIVADGAGGAIVTWYDLRGGSTYDIYAQHVLASGNPDPAWPADGRALCTAAGNQSNPNIVADGAGGAIVTWQDTRSGNNDIYAQHLLASGTADPTWPADGRALCTAIGNQSTPTIVADGAGGAIVTWQDFRSGTSNDIYSQHVLASGNTDPAWPADGRALCTAAGDQFVQTIAADGVGGAIVTWQDNRSGNYDIYAQHVLASGSPDPTWPADGRALCTAVNSQGGPTIVADGAGGAIVTWYDLRGGTSYDIYTQHVLASGSPDPAWPVNGRALCTASGDQTNPMIVADGAGGAIVTWQDTRSGNYDIYAQHVLASGSPDPAWPADGRALCTAANSQGAPTLVADAAGGAIVAWQDYRSGTSNDIYAQRVARFGYLGTPEAEIVSVKDVPNDQGGKVKLSWNASYLDPLADANLSTYDVLRSVPTRLAVELSSRGTRTRPLAGDGFDARPGDLMTQVFGASTLYWEYLTTIPVLHYVSGYSFLAPTTGDSTVSSNPTTSFMVVARNASNTMYWPSVPASGYSVDNLAPTAPAPFTGQFAAGTAKLHWNRNTESDLAGYRLYRGASAAFVPSAGNRIASPADTGYTDVAGVPAYYKLTAVDLHGNESPIATLMPTGTTGVEGGVAPAALEFAAPSPNPAREAASLRFTLPRAGAVRVTILDAAGRVVREIADGAREAGTYSLTWDLRDLGGHPVSAGLYFARLMTSAGTMTRRIAVTR